MKWAVPREWPGETVFILGGGNSLKGFDAEVLRGRGRVIAIKEAGLTMAPWADVIYWADKVWCDGDSKRPANGARLHLHTGRYKITRSKCDKTFGHDVKLLDCDQKAGLSTDPTKIGGVCSGGNCINLAYLFGAKRIVLLGFDMSGPNWDGRERRAERDHAYTQRFMPAIARMALPLQQAGVEVINATPGSALKCFTQTTLEAVLARTPRKPREDLEPEAQDDSFFAAPEDVAGEDEADEPAVDEPVAEEPAAAENYEPFARAQGRAVSDAAASSLAAPAKPAAALTEHTGLELHEPRQIAQAVMDMRGKAPVMLRIRIRGADVVTRRSADWWRMQLSVVFADILEHPAPGGVVLFECRSPRV